jgi:hypothetical protein
MSKFTPLVKFETSFEGDKVVIQLRRLKRKAMMKLTPFLTEGDEGDGKLDEMAIMGVATEILPEHVASFKGLFQADGTEITFKEAIEESYFMGLITEMIQELFRISKLDEDDAENSQGQPVTSASVTELSVEKSSAELPVKNGSEL